MRPVSRHGGYWAAEMRSGSSLRFPSMPLLVGLVGRTAPAPAPDDVCSVVHSRSPATWAPWPFAEDRPGDRDFHTVHPRSWPRCEQAANVCVLEQTLGHRTDTLMPLMISLGQCLCGRKENVGSLALFVATIYLFYRLVTGEHKSGRRRTSDWRLHVWNKNERDGKIGQAKGRVKQAVGDLTSDKDLEAEGRVDEAAAKSRKAWVKSVERPATRSRRSEKP